MKKRVQIGIRTKILLVIIPVLISSFILSGYIAVVSSRKNLFSLSEKLMIYKMEQLQNFSNSQWLNLQKSGFSGIEIYENIVRESIQSYAEGMIRSYSELILVLDREGHTVFTTSEEFGSSGERITALPVHSYRGSRLSDYETGGRIFTGISGEIENFGWQLLILEDKNAFTRAITEITLFQTLSFSLALVIILTCLILALKMIIDPINRVRETINNITEDKDFSHKVNIEFPDEIGELAFDFNNMISNLDRAYRQMKKFALEEASAKKVVYLRERETLDLLGSASDYKDPETGTHIKRVSHYSLVLSRALMHDKSLQDLLYYAAPLHDIGKIGIPDSVLLKPGRLTEEEFSIIKTHTRIGYEILKNSSSKYLKAGAVISLSHHEKYDGSGYPRGIMGDNIPILGRIVAIADVFDALTTKRPYKEAWPLEKAMELIRSEKGGHFDPEIADLFISHISEIKEIYQSI